MALTKIPASLLDTSSGINGLIYPTSDGTSGQFLKTDGSGNLTFATTYTDSDVETYLDGGTSTPTFATATVSGTLTVTGDLDITGNVNSYNVTDLDVTDQTITLGAGQTEANSGGSGIIIDGSSASILWDETNDVFDFNKGLTTLGSVGIGTTSPASTISGSAAVLHLYDGTNNNLASLALQAGTVGSKWEIGALSSNALGFFDDGSERMRIDSSGKVIIKTDYNSPQLSTMGYGDWGNLPLQLQDSSLTNTAGYVVTGIGFGYSSETTAAIVVTDEGGSAAQSMSFITGTNTGAVPRMTIDQSGKVGIGTTNPSDYYSNSLVVSATAEKGITIAATGTSMANYLMFADGTSGDAKYRGYLAYNHSGDDMVFATAATERMYIDSSGRVGIAQDTPGDFFGGADDLVIGNSGGDFGITIRTSTSGNGNIMFADGVSGNQQYRGSIQYIHTHDAMVFGTNGGTERMRISSDGDVRINTTGQMGNATLTVKAYTSTNTGLMLQEYDTSNAYGLYTVTSDDSFRITRFVSGSYSDRLIIASNGRTSIGTTSTNAGLHVANADIRCSAPAVANDANSISMSYESVGGVIAVRGPSTSTRGSLHLSVNQSNGGGGRVGFKIDNLGLIYAEYMGSGGATTDVNYNTSTGEIYQVTSSQRYKENISEYTDSILEKVNNLTVKNFDYKEGGYTNQIGLIAEEVEEQIPYLVNKKEIEGYDEPQPDSVKYSQLSVFLLKAIQEQQTIIESLQSRIEALEE